MEKAIAIFAKPPVAGQTKSRLAAGTSPEFAAKLSGAMLADLVSQAVPVGADVFLYHPPDCDPAAFGGLLNQISGVRIQSGDDLGERMYTCIRELLASGYSRVILIGSDCIAHSADSLNGAFTALVENDLVVQPAEDGGYVLIGMTVAEPRVFSGINWGSDAVMAQTRNTLERNRLCWAELDCSFDIDTADDLDRLRNFIRTNSRPHVEKVLNDFELDDQG